MIFQGASMSLKDKGVWSRIEAGRQASVFPCDQAKGIIDSNRHAAAAGGGRGGWGAGFSESSHSCDDAVCSMTYTLAHFVQRSLRQNESMFFSAGKAVYVKHMVQAYHILL